MQFLHQVEELGIVVTGKRVTTAQQIITDFLEDDVRGREEGERERERERERGN